MAPRLKLKSENDNKEHVLREQQPFVPDPTPATANTEPAPSVGRNRKILVVDDNQVVLKAFQLKLQASGFTVITSSDGGKVSGIVEAEQPALIILDVNFPAAGSGLQWNGLTIMQWLRRIMEGPTVPIIIVTGEDPAKHQKKFMDAGAAAFFQKPVKYEELLVAILRILG